MQRTAAQALVCSLAACTVLAQNGASVSPPLEAVYKKNCAACHDASVPRAPTRAAMSRMSPESVRFALASGAMAAQGRTLTAAEIASVSEFLTGKVSSSDAFPKQPFCPAEAAAFDDAFAKPNWNGWGGGLSQHRFQPAAMAQLSPEQAFGDPGVIDVPKHFSSTFSTSFQGEIRLQNSRRTGNSLVNSSYLGDILDVANNGRGRRR